MHLYGMHTEIMVGNCGLQRTAVELGGKKRSNPETPALIKTFRVTSSGTCELVQRKKRFDGLIGRDLFQVITIFFSCLTIFNNVS